MSTFQIIIVSHWPQKIGIIHETGELLIEYEHTVITSSGIDSKREVIKIPQKIEPPKFNQ